MVEYKIESLEEVNRDIRDTLKSLNKEMSELKLSVNTLVTRDSERDKNQLKLRAWLVPVCTALLGAVAGAAAHHYLW